MLAVIGPLDAAQAAPDDVLDGQTLLLDCVARLASIPCLDVRLRQSSVWFGQELGGSGTYLQTHSPRGLLLRYELKLQLGDQRSSLLQVCDGRFLWIRRELPGGASLGRVDMDRIREALGDGDQPAWAGAAAYGLAVGGLPQVLAALAANFQFSPPSAVQTSQTRRWMITGHWKPEPLAAVLPDQRARIEAGQPADLAKLPAQLPTEVRLLLGQDDHLPYRIEYRRTASAGPQRSPDSSDREQMLVLEIVELQRCAALDENLFTFQPGTHEVADFTALYLQSLHPTAAASDKSP